MTTAEKKKFRQNNATDPEGMAAHNREMKAAKRAGHPRRTKRVRRTKLAILLSGCKKAAQRISKARARMDRAQEALSLAQGKLIDAQNDRIVAQIKLQAFRYRAKPAND